MGKWHWAETGHVGRQCWVPGKIGLSRREYIALRQESPAWWVRDRRGYERRIWEDFVWGSLWNLVFSLGKDFGILPFP